MIRMNKSLCIFLKRLTFIFLGINIFVTFFGIFIQENSYTKLLAGGVVAVLSFLSGWSQVSRDKALKDFSTATVVVRLFGVFGFTLCIIVVSYVYGAIFAFAFTLLALIAECVSVIFIINRNKRAK